MDSPDPRRPGPRLGLALGSGSARGWAHIGVLRALHEAGIVPDVVCGASIGAFVGAAYANGDLDKLETWVRGLGWQDVFGFFDVGFNGGLLKGEKLTAFFSRHFVDRDFHELGLPFACVATDLANGREVWLREGSVASAVRASIALPGLFSPQLREGRFLVDGGIVNPVPVSLCRALGADVVLAVDLGSDVVGRHLKRRRQEPEASSLSWSDRLLRAVSGRDAGPSLLDVLAGSINIMQVRIARSRLAGEPADVLVTPRLAALGLLDFHRAEDAIAEGREAMVHALPQLRHSLEDWS